MEKQMAQRLIVFVELVKGCNNKGCPSWGKVCVDNDQQFMSLETAVDVTTKISKALLTGSAFKVVDFWMYGCGDSLDHPQAMGILELFHSRLHGLGKLAMAIDSRREIPDGGWYGFLDKLKIIHKCPETYDWEAAARRWASVPTPKSHKLITQRITTGLWKFWQDHGPGSVDAFVTEMKAVPFHDIVLGTDDPVFTKRTRFVFDDGLPVEHGPYPGVPVRRTMIRWDGSLRRCLIAATRHKTLDDLFFGDDEICNTCFPLTGGELVKFHPEKIVVTPSANCVSDGYYRPLEPVQRPWA